MNACLYISETKHANIHTLTNSNTHSYTHIHNQTFTHIHPPTNTDTHTLTHTNTFSNTHTHTHLSIKSKASTPVVLNIFGLWHTELKKKLAAHLGQKSSYFEPIGI